MTTIVKTHWSNILWAVGGSLVGIAGTAFIQYSVQGYLGRSDLTILKSNGIKTSNVEFPLNKDSVVFLRTLPIWKDAITSNTSLECDSEIDGLRVSIDCLRQFVVGLRTATDILNMRRTDLDSNVTALREYLSHSKTNKNGNNDTPPELLEVPITSLYEPLNMIVKNRPEATMACMRSEARHVGEQLESLDTLTKSSTDGLEKKTPNALSFEVGVINSGNTDAVVFSEAVVTLYQTEIKLIMKRPGLSSKRPNFRVVRAHSYEVIVFEPNEKHLAEIHQRAIESAIKNAAPTSFSMAIDSATEKGIRGAGSIDGEGEVL